MIVRKLNAVTGGDSFRILLIEDMLDQVGDCKILSKIDLPKGFYQVPLSGVARAVRPVRPWPWQLS